MYGLRSITVHDLMPGWNHHDEDGPSAIYMHDEQCAELCLSYALYVHLFEDGKYIGVLLKLGIMQEKRITKQNNTFQASTSSQWVTYPGFYRVLGCYLHILDQGDLEKLYSKGQAPHINRRWQPELEIHPDDEKISVFLRSKKRTSQNLYTDM